MCPPLRLPIVIPTLRRDLPMPTRTRRAPRLLAYAAAVALALVCVADAGAQVQAPDPAFTAQIRAEAYQHSQVLETATMLSDVFGPRLAGSPEYRAAAEWARGRLAGWGLTAALEPWGRRRPGWDIDRYSVEMTSPRYLRLNAYPKAWSPSTPGTVSGTPVLVNVRTEADFAQYRGKLRGMIVMNGGLDSVADRFAPLATRMTAAELDSLAKVTDPGSPKTYWEDFDEWVEALKHRRAVNEFFHAEGVAAVLEPSRTFEGIRLGAYNAYDTDASTYPPAFVVAREHYDQVVRLLQRGRPVRIELSLQSHTVRDDSTGYNVVAELPGTDPTLRAQVVMAGGHLDSWTAGTGATDNAAGCAVAMEALRILKAIGARPKRTIRIALWDGEEQEDYFGSMGYVKRHFGDPATMALKPEHALLSAYYNYDTGTGRVRAVSLQGNAAARPYIEAFLAPWHDLGAATVTLANTGSTDHMPFTSVGLPAFNLIQDPIDYETRTHHTSLDVADYLVEDDLKQSAAVLASLLLSTANLPDRMPRPPLPAPRSATH
jgi:carboxypeptidase Q